MKRQDKLVIICSWTLLTVLCINALVQTTMTAMVLETEEGAEVITTTLEDRGLMLTTTQVGYLLVKHVLEHFMYLFCFAFLNIFINVKPSHKMTLEKNGSEITIIYKKRGE